MTERILVEDKLPQDGERVLALVGGREVVAMRHQGKWRVCWTMEVIPELSNKVTEWQPIAHHPQTKT